MNGFQYTTHWDGHLSISPSPPRPPRPIYRKDAPGNSRKLTKSKTTPARAASYSSAISFQPSDEQDSDCYIVNQTSQENRASRPHKRASIQLERVSSFGTLPAKHLREPSQSSNLNPQTKNMLDPSVTGDHSHLQLYPSLSSKHKFNRVATSSSSIGSSSRRGRTTLNPSPKPFPVHDVIEVDDEEDIIPRNDVIEISSDSEDEMDVDDMLASRVSTSLEPEPASSPVPSSSSLNIDSLFTPPPSRTRRRRVILDHILVPPFPEGLTMADYKSSSEMSFVAPGQGVQYTSVSDALAAAFAQNKRPPPPPPDRKGKGRECGTPSPAPVSPKRRKSISFGEDISTVPATILNVYYPPIELDIPDFPPYLDDTWHRNTYWIERIRFKRHHAELHHGLQEMVTHMKSLGSGCDKKDTSPTLPRVFAPLLDRRPDIAASLAAQWEPALPKHSCNSKSTNIPEPQNTSSSSNGLLPCPDLSKDDLSNSHFSLLEEDQPLDISMEMYLNDLGDSPGKSHPSGTKDLHVGRTASSPYCDASNLNGFFHDTTHLPPEVGLDAPDNVAVGFLGVPPSPKDLPSPVRFTESYSAHNSYNFDDNFERVFEEGTWSGLPNVFDDGVVSSQTVSLPGNANTIDPSLLGGKEPSPKLHSRGGPRASENQTPGPIIYVRRPPGVSASQEAPLHGTSKKRRNVQIKYRMSGSASPPNEGDVMPSTGGAGVTELAAEAGSRTRPSLKIRIRRSCASDGSFVPSQPSTSASPVVTDTPLPKESTPTPVPSDPQAFEPSFCHQCRRMQTKPKMQCSKRRQGYGICGKLFCDRCILNRYPEITFDRLSKTFICPVCTDTCNCSICARKRGEEYISMRGDSSAALRAKSGILLLPDATPSGQVQDIQTAPPASAPQKTFWAHVYGLEGERVGRAFVGDVGASISARPMQPVKGRGPKASKSKPKPKPKEPRVFIGPPLREWKVSTFRDLKPGASTPPPVPGEESYVGKGKGKAVERPRVYIGDPRWLNVPYSRMPASPPPELGEEEWGLDSDGSLTSLEDLEEAMDWPRPDVGEAVTVTWAPVDERSASLRLTPDEVEKVIGIALAASRVTH